MDALVAPDAIKHVLLGSKEGRNSQWMDVRMDYLRLLWHIYRSDSGLVACRNILHNALLSHGVGYHAHGYSMRKEFSDHVIRHFPRFCRDVMDNLCVQV